VSTRTVALVGRPNTGKSSLYNRVTGGSARVGNFPGITVDVLEATVELGGAKGALRVVDLPGLYSFDSELDADTDEGAARAFIEREQRDNAPFAVLQVLDATQLSLSLRLTKELLGQASRVALVLTQSDVLEGEGRKCDVDALSKAVGVPVIAVSSRDASTRDAVIALAQRVLDGPARAPSAGTFDPEQLARAVLSDAPSVDEQQRKRREFTERLDRWLLHRTLGPALFVLTMVLLFGAVFLVAEPASGAMDATTKWLGAKLSPRLGGGYLASFVTDGIIGGAGTVLAFLPQIVVLTIALELLDASGYLARGVFLIDRLLRVFGLGGKAFVPLLTAHACAVPAIRATRILRDPRERLVTLLVLPLMTCSARLPTYGLLLSAFFAQPGRAVSCDWCSWALFAAGGLSGAMLASRGAAASTAVRGRLAAARAGDARVPRARTARLVGRTAWRRGACAIPCPTWARPSSRRARCCGCCSTSPCRARRSIRRRRHLRDAGRGGPDAPQRRGGRRPRA
jgi:ferrous iron transport protein B